MSDDNQLMREPSFEQNIRIASADRGYMADKYLFDTCI